MLYFYRRSFDKDKTLSEHNKILRQTVYDLLYNTVMKQKQLNDCSELQFKYNKYGKPYFRLS